MGTAPDFSLESAELTGSSQVRGLASASPTDISLVLTLRIPSAHKDSVEQTAQGVFFGVPC